MPPSGAAATGAKRARRGGVEHTHLRLRMPHLLAQLSLEPRGLPPAAILIVRRLADPLPRSIEAGERRASPAWERAVQSELDGLHRRAARPANGPVAPSAEAVVFGDMSELLAVAADDVAAGVAGARWWWRTILRSLPRDATPLAGLLLSRVDCVPAAFALLLHRGTLGAVIAALGPPDAATLLRTLAGVFDLGDGVAAPSLGGHSPAAAALAPSAPVADDERALESRAPLRVRSALEAVIRDVDACAPAASGAVRLLAVAALALARAPGVVRHPAFVAELHRLLAPGRARTAARLPDAAPVRDALRAMESHAIAPPLSVSPVPPSHPAHAPPRPRPRVTVQRSAAVAERAATHGGTTPSPVRGGAGWAERTPPPDADDSGIATSLAGVLFLVHVVRALGLPRAVNERFAIDSAIGPWGWVELLARALLARRPAHRHDPVWRALAVLDARDPACWLRDGFTGREPYIVPRAWQAFVRGHGARAHAARRCAVLGPPVSPALERFLAFLMPVVRRRLCRALGVPRRALAHALLERSGRLFVTPTDLDVVMPSGEVTLSVRRAGLDADPGWAPDFGRIIRFHYP